MKTGRTFLHIVTVHLWGVFLIPRVTRNPALIRANKLAKYT